MMWIDWFDDVCCEAEDYFPSWSCVVMDFLMILIMEIVWVWCFITALLQDKEFKIKTTKDGLTKYEY